MKSSRREGPLNLFIARVVKLTIYMRGVVTKSIVTPQNLIRSKQRKGKLKKSIKISNKKPVKIV